METTGKSLLFILLITASQSIAALPTPAAAPPADPQVTAAQTLLKEADLYQGEITGVLDYPTQAALRRFQMLRNLRVTGSMDDLTLAQLHLPPTSQVKADREFLQEPPANPPAVAEESAPPSPLSPPSRATAASPPSSIPPQMLRSFLEYYLKAASQPSIAPQLTYFANAVDYYGHSSVTQDWLRSELENNRYTPVRFELLKLEHLTGTDRNQASIRFQVKITPKTRRKGTRSSVEWREATIARTAEGALKFTSLRKAE